MGREKKGVAYGLSEVLKEEEEEEEEEGGGGGVGGGGELSTEG